MKLVLPQAAKSICLKDQKCCTSLRDLIGGAPLKFREKRRKAQHMAGIKPTTSLVFAPHACRCVTPAAYSKEHLCAQTYCPTPLRLEKSSCQILAVSAKVIEPEAMTSTLKWATRRHQLAKFDKSGNLAHLSFSRAVKMQKHFSHKMKIWCLTPARVKFMTFLRLFVQLYARFSRIKISSSKAVLFQQFFTAAMNTSDVKLDTLSFNLGWTYFLRIFY